MRNLRVKNRFGFLSMALLALSLSACGGGSDSAEPAAVPVTLDAVSQSVSVEPPQAPVADAPLVVVEEVIEPVVVDAPAVVIDEVIDPVIVEAPAVVEQVTEPIVEEAPAVVTEEATESVVVDTPQFAARGLALMVISPFIESTSKGSLISFTSTGIYTDQSSEDLSAQVSWSVDDASMASIDETGTVSVLNAGVVTVTASYDGVNAQKILTITPATLDSIEIIPQQLDIAAGLQQAFKAIGNYSDGSSQDLTHQVEWLSADSQLLQVSSESATALLPGSVVISAALQGVTAQAAITVNPAILQSIEVSSPALLLEVGLQHSLKVLAFYSDQSIHDISAQVDWLVEDAAVASIDPSTKLITALNAGSTMLYAAFSGFSAQSTLQVNDAVLSRIEISPSTAAIAAGYQQVFKATAVYSNQQSRDLTGQVTWASSDSAIAGIDNRLEAKGSSTGFTKGAATISAYFEGQSATAEIVVTDAELISIEVSPANISVAKGLQQQFTATAFYSDGSQNLVTEQVRWSSGSSVMTQVDSQSEGLFQANEKGSVLVIASLNNLLSSKQGYTSVEVSDAVLDGLILVNENDRLAVGTRQRVTAFGQYTDGSSVDLSRQVSWSSSAVDVAHVNNAVDSKGLLTGVSPGSVIIGAQIDGIQASTTIDITAAILQQITLLVSAESLFVSQSRQIDSVGLYSDGSQQGLTDQLHWFSSDDSVLSVSNADDAKGALSALSAGQASIQASVDGISSDVITLTVIDNPNLAASVSIQASPNVILNDGSDSSTIRATVKPLQQQGVVADGTAVNFVVEENGETRIVSTQTLNGVASIELNSLNSGYINVTAELADTELNATAVLFSTDNFARVLQVVPVSKATLANNNSLYLKDSVFGLFIRNLSNRDFALLAFQMKNGEEYLPGLPVTDASYLSGGVLEAGEYTGAGYSLDSDTLNNGITAGYFLGDSVTQRVFGFTIGFNAGF